MPPQPVVASAGELSSLPQLIIRPGESGGMLTQTEYVVSKFCAEHRLKKYTGDDLLAMIRRKDFVREDIRYETIRELEQIIEKGSGSKVFEYDLWSKEDGKQEVKVYLRSLWQIVDTQIVLAPAQAQEADCLC